MPKKGKRRREAHRERREQLKSSRESEVPVGVPAAPQPRREQAPPRAWRETARAKKKRASRGGFPVSPWLAITPVAVIVIAVIGWVAFSGGGGGGGSTPAPTATVDPRVKGLTPTASFTIQALGGSDNSYFSPNTLTVKAGQVFQVTVNNAGNVTHNLTIAGVDGKYDTPDDWTSVPYDIKAGQSGTLTVKIDKPGSYAFRCAFHPLTETGTLTVQ